MGSSGAGKTSFLNCLCGRIRQSRLNRITGDTRLNDLVKLSNTNFTRYGAYVMQDNALLSTSTPRESLIFAAKLRLGGSDEERMKRVDELIEMFSLGKC